MKVKNYLNPQFSGRFDYPVNPILFVLSVLIFCQTNLLYAQQQSSVLDAFRKHINYLASDELEGRATGSKGEALAADYIANVFEEIGLVPKGEKNDHYFQSFTFVKGKEWKGDNYLWLNGQSLSLQEDYYPLNKSSNGKLKGALVNVAYGIEAPDLRYDDFSGRKVKGKVVVMDISSPDGVKPDSKYKDYNDLDDRINNVVQKGAKAVLLVNSDDELADPVSKNISVWKDYAIPVVFITEKAESKLDNAKKVKLAVQATKEQKTGKNVVGYIDNSANQTVVIGAHYDHLGHGESGGSLYTGKDKAIHNGADDNASGVAMLLELARYLKQSDMTENNYLFIAFSGEELGLFGSNFFVRNITVPKTEMNYMLNFDMVGRLSCEPGNLIINGTGTSPAWDILEEMENDQLHISTTEAGIGGSDHTSFYIQKIPALHFFSGSHSDYHKPSDDADKINYEGMKSIMDFSIALIDSLEEEPKLEFQATKQEAGRKSPKFSVTMGVMPDYMFSGEGMRISGIIDDRPAQKAGLQEGDTVIQLGEVKVEDMQSYMAALGALKKGQATKVTILRNGEKKIFDIQF